MILEPIFLIFLGLVLFLDIYLDMIFFFQNLFVDLEILGYKGQEQNWGSLKFFYF